MANTVKYTRDDINAKVVELKNAALIAAAEDADKVTLVESVDELQAQEYYTLLTENIRQAVHAFNEAQTHGASEDELKDRMAVENTAVAYYNWAKIWDRIEELKRMKYVDAMSAFLQNQETTGKRITKEKDKSHGFADKSNLPMPTATVIKELSGDTTYSNIQDALCVWADNVARFALHSDAKDQKITMGAMSESYRELKARMGWDVAPEKLSLTVLAAQLTELCKLVFHKDAAPAKMLNCDVRFVMHGLIGTKATTNAAGKYILRQEETILELVFRAAYTRYHGKKYEFQNDTNSVNAPRNADPMIVAATTSKESAKSDVAKLA